MTVLASDLSLSSCSSTSSSSFINTPEIYEEWILRWTPPVKNVNRSSSFLGLSLKSYNEDRGFWGTDPEYRTQDEMKEQAYSTSADKSPSKLKRTMQKAVQAMPKNGGEAIDTLLEERMEASNNGEGKREWTVIAVRPKQKHIYSMSKKWGEDPKTTDWLVTIKGETVDAVERSRGYRHDDPWRISVNQRYRSFGPRRDHYCSTPRRTRHRRSRSPPLNRERLVERVPSPPPIMRRGPLALVNSDGIPEEGVGSCTVVIGKILNKEEAEKKIDEIWDAMIREVTSEPDPAVKETAA